MIHYCTKMIVTYESFLFIILFELIDTYFNININVCTAAQK